LRFLGARHSLKTLVEGFVLRLDDVGRVRLRGGGERNQAEYC
jgi:hypothetical protein